MDAWRFEISLLVLKKNFSRESCAHWACHVAAMWNGHVILNSVLIPYLYLCFLICGYSNCINKPNINPTDPEEALNLTNIISSNEILENGVSTSLASGTKPATNTIKKKFLWRRLLYFPNGTESFNPVMIQIILSGDVHPQPGPNSKQKQNSRPGKIQRKITQLRTWLANMQVRASRLLIWIFALWSLANTVFYYNIPLKIMTLIFLLYQRLGSTRRLIIKPCRFLDLYSSAKIGENINLVAALPCTSETHSKRHF